MRVSDHALQRHMCITENEVQSALNHMSSRKALPPKQVPAILWKLAGEAVVPLLCQAYNQVLAPGIINFPLRWHSAFMTLIPKPGKAPDRPAHLRPICLLPAESKLLARIAAERLKPLLQQALKGIPQFAYSRSRQAADAIDRVCAHCSRVRSKLKTHSRTGFDLQQKHATVPLTGGMILSLDMSRAYDKLPRETLEHALVRVSAPRDLITLILYIHDRARVIFERHGREDGVSLGRGIRQGCGLSPLLWLAFTLLLHDHFHEYLPADVVTGYADDYEMQWEFTKASEFRNACIHVGRILDTLTAAGMDVARDKTVILLAIKGKEAAALLKTFTARRQGKRFLRLQHLGSQVMLPIKTTHTYLGVRIGYSTFEKATVTHRLNLSWVAFHRLHLFLKSPQIPLRKRVLLWLSTVWATIRYGLEAVGLDPQAARQLESQVFRQLRIVARSPGHITHETNSALLKRLSLRHPFDMLHKISTARLESCRAHLQHLQPAVVQQWWVLLASNFAALVPPDRTGSHLVDITQQVAFHYQCPHCPQAFPTFHSLNVHLGKSHSAQQPRKDKNPTLKNKRRDDYRVHSLTGMPQCKHCLRRFHAWPQFMGHVDQRACEGLQAAYATSESQHDGSGKLKPDTSSQGALAPGGVPALEHDILPLLYRPELQSLARQQQPKTLAAAVRQANCSNHCPECYQWCTSHSYVVKHAVKMHASVQQAQASVAAWVQARTCIQRPVVR